LIEVLRSMAMMENEWPRAEARALPRLVHSEEWGAAVAE
jgi:hypothetical protein